MLVRLLFALGLGLVVLQADVCGTITLPGTQELESGDYELRIETREVAGEELEVPRNETSQVQVIGEGSLFAIRPKRIDNGQPPAPPQVTKLRKIDEFRGRNTESGALKAAMTRVVLTEGKQVGIRTIHLTGQITENGAKGTMIVLNAEGKILRRANWELKPIE